MILLAGSGVSSLGSLMRAAARPGLLEAAPSVLPATGQVRFKRKINVKRPHQPDWFRKQLLAVSKPQWEPPVPIEEEHLKCEYVEKAEEKVKWKDHIHQLEKFYVEEMLDEFRSSEMIAFYHTNPILRNNFRKGWQLGRKMGMELKSYNKRVGRAGLVETEWENCLHFFMDCFDHDHEQPILFSPVVKPKNLISFEKKIPEFHLLGAVIHGRILSRKQVIALGDMPDLEYQRQELVTLLNTNQSKLTSLLQSNQEQLSRNLAQLIKDNNKQ